MSQWAPMARRISWMAKATLASSIRHANCSTKSLSGSRTSPSVSVTPTPSGCTTTTSSISGIVSNSPTLTFQGCGCSTLRTALASAERTTSPIGRCRWAKSSGLVYRWSEASFANRPFASEARRTSSEGVPGVDIGASEMARRRPLEGNSGGTSPLPVPAALRLPTGTDATSLALQRHPVARTSRSPA